MVSHGDVVRTSTQALAPVGNTVRLAAPAGPCPPVAAALVVSDSVQSKYWLNMLPLCADPRVRHYITLADIQRLVAAGRLGVEPPAVPAFLVFRDGFVIDAFPAPSMPPPSAAPLPANPYALLTVVLERLRAYE